MVQKLFTTFIAIERQFRHLTGRMTEDLAPDMYIEPNAYYQIH